MTESSLHIKFSLSYEADADITDIERFAQALGGKDVLTAIKRHNPELKSLTYTPERTFQGEVSIHPANHAPFTAGEFEADNFRYSLEVISALGTLLRRIFWLPPHPPRISGYFTFEIEEYILNGNVYNATSETDPGGGGGIHGGI